MVYVPNVDDFINWLHETIAAHANVLCMPPYPPCDDQQNPYYVLEINIERCWKYKNEEAYRGEIFDYVPRLYPCKGTGVWCQTIWRICLDYNYTPARLTITSISKDVIGSPGCLTEKPELPPQGKTFDEPWETYCFETACQ